MSAPESPILRALSLWQPWASFVVADGAPKQHETRSWATQIRGPLLIHATKSEPAEVGMWALRDPDFRVVMLDALGVGDRSAWADLPRGAILGIVELVDCVPVERVRPTWPDSILGDYSGGRYAWRFERARRFREPIPCRGGQGLWTLAPDIAKQVRATGVSP